MSGISSVEIADRRMAVLLRAWKLEHGAPAEELRAYLERMPLGDLVAEPELGVLLFSAYVYGYDPRAREIEKALVPGFELRGNDRLTRRFINFRGAQRLQEGALPEAEMHFRRVEWMSNAAGDERTLCYALANWGVVAYTRLEINQALRASERALVLARRTRDTRTITNMFNNIAILYRSLGMYADAERYWERCLRLPRNTTERAVIAQERAVLYLLTDRIEAAELFARNALQTLQAGGIGFRIADALRVVGMVAAAKGDLTGAERELRRALSYPLGGEPLTEAEIQEELAVVATRQGNDSESRASEEIAIRIYRRMDAPLQIERVRERLAQVRAQA